MPETLELRENILKVMGIQIPVRVWSFFIRFVAPIPVLIIFFLAAGFFDKFFK
jgi:hypothetical protein